MTLLTGRQQNRRVELVLSGEAIGLKTAEPVPRRNSYSLTNMKRGTRSGSSLFCLRFEFQMRKRLDCCRPDVVAALKDL